MKGCPFCGGRAAVKSVLADPSLRQGATYQVSCTVCGTSTESFPNAEKAKEKWEVRSGIIETHINLVAWMDLHSGVIIHTLGDKPLVHGFNLKSETDRREGYRVANWLRLSDLRKEPST